MQQYPQTDNDVNLVKVVAAFMCSESYVAAVLFSGMSLGYNVMKVLDSARRVSRTG